MALRFRLKAVQYSHIWMLSVFILSLQIFLGRTSRNLLENSKEGGTRAEAALLGDGHDGIFVIVIGSGHALELPYSVFCDEIVIISTYVLCEYL